MASINHSLANWAMSTSFSDLSDEVVLATKLRVADIIALMFAGSELPFGKAVCRAIVPSAGLGKSSVAGFGIKAPPAYAAIVNGACAHCLEYDDTHVESAVHVGSSVVTAALAVAEEQELSGKDLIRAVAVGTELTCRLGVVAPGEFHRHAFHPTGIFGAFGATYAASLLRCLTNQQIRNAIGIVGSQAAGVTAAWMDGADAKSMHPGWSAHCGIVSTLLAEEGVTGPDEIFEGRLGLFFSHVQNADHPFDFERAIAGLGADWETLNISFKMYPTGHLIQAFLDALYLLMQAEGLTADQVELITCPIADHMVPLVAEPVEAKLDPQSAWHCRVSLQWSLAELLVLGRLDRFSYDLTHPRVPEIRNLAKRVTYTIDPDASDRSVWKGQVVVTTKDGRRLERSEAANRGSRQNPASPQELQDKFISNLANHFDATDAENMFLAICALEDMPNVRGLVP